MQERFPFLRARCERVAVGGAGSSCLFSALELTNNNISISDKDVAVFIILCLAYKAFFESIETMVASKHHHSYTCELPAPLVALRSTRAIMPGDYSRPAHLKG